MVVVWVRPRGRVSGGARRLFSKRVPSGLAVREGEGIRTLVLYLRRVFAVMGVCVQCGVGGEVAVVVWSRRSYCFISPEQ